MLSLWRTWRRRKFVRCHTLPEGPWQEALRHVPVAGTLSREEMLRLRELVLLFLHEKRFEGADGLQVTEMMRLVIAIQACLLICNLDFRAYDGWTSIVIYPAGFFSVHSHTDDLGVVHQGGEPTSGEAWQKGGVVLSWEDAYEGAHWPDNGYNVIVHEFAHLLDMLDGEANGTPPLHAGMSLAQWQADFQSAFKLMRSNLEQGRDDRIDDYAAEDPAEFFAVMSEAFFGTPGLVAESFPRIYEHLKAFYRQDPLSRVIAMKYLDEPVDD